MVGKTERTLKRNILDVIGDILGGQNFTLSRGTGEAWIGKRHVYLAAAYDERAETRIRGMTLAGAYGDEITIWPESFFQMLLSRLSVPGSKFFGTTNPDSPYHWLKRNYLDRADVLDLKTWHFMLDDNLSLAPEFVESLKKEYTGLWYKRFIEGLWVAAEGAVYDMLDESVHVVDDVPDIHTYWIAVDYGTANPTVFLLIGHGVDGNYYVVDEWRWDSVKQGKQKTDAEYRESLIDWIENHGVRPACVIVDPSAASFIAEIRNHIVTRAADNSVNDGIRRVAKLLSQRRLFIHRRCEGLLAELMGYVWDPRSQQLGVDAPIKIDDHGPDALRYWANFIASGRNVMVFG
jgi:PBSX family phage terminase large subunit